MPSGEKVRHSRGSEYSLREEGFRPGALGLASGIRTKVLGGPVPGASRESRLATSYLLVVNVSPFDTVYWTPFTTPLGEAFVASTERGLCRLTVPNESREHFFVWLRNHFEPTQILPHPGPNMEIIDELDAYWRGERTRFDLRLDLRGTPFQLSVWEALLHVPFGKTISYRDLAEQVDLPRGYQAVGAAVGQNPILVIVPCHRVLGVDGGLTGYAAGPDTKRWLLQHEGALLL